jgi:hypothetical protein
LPPARLKNPLIVTERNRHNNTAIEEMATTMPMRSQERTGANHPLPAAPHQALAPEAADIPAPVPDKPPHEIPVQSMFKRLGEITHGG